MRTFGKYCTRIAYFHPWKKSGWREKCVLKTYLAYNDIEYITKYDLKKDLVIENGCMKV